MHENNRGVARRLLATGVTVALTTAGVVAGSMTAAHAAPVPVTTTLTDLAGNALDGVAIAYQLQPDGYYDEVVRQTVADGVVSLPVEPGTYKFAFGDYERVFTPEFYNDKPTLDTADAVVIGGPATLAPVALAPAPTVHGQVLSPTGRAIPNANISLFKAADGAPAGSTQSRPDGSFAINAVPGDYKVYFAGGQYAAEYYNNKPTLATADVVTVGAAGANLGPVTLTEGAVITGRITSPTGSPLERAMATLYTVTESGTQSLRSDLADSNGVYSIEGVPAGTYKIQFSDPVNEYASEWFNDKATSETADPITVGVEGVVGQVDAALTPRPAIDPATIDLSGVVVDSAGAPVMGATVVAFDTPADADRPEGVDFATSNRAGAYSFTELGASSTSENAFKIQARDDLAREEGQYLRLDRWFGDTQSYVSATTTGVPASGANITLPLTGGITGVVTSESGLPVDSVGVGFFETNGEGVSLGGASVKEDGTYLTTGLVPGKYKVLFSDSSFNSYTITRVHSPEWYDDTVFSQAKIVTVTSGRTTTGINAALSENLKALRKPEILGSPYLKGKVRATPGTWSMGTGTSYKYEWLLGEAVIGTGSTLEVPGAAKNKRITLRVTASNSGHDGTALASTQVIKKKPKVKIAVKGKKAKITVSGKKIKPKKIKGKVVVKKIVRTDEFGAPVYKAVGKGKLANGTASITLKKLIKGKNELVFFITLKGGKLGDATIAKKIKYKG